MGCWSPSGALRASMWKTKLASVTEEWLHIYIHSFSSSVYSEGLGAAIPNNNEYM